MKSTIYETALQQEQERRAQKEKLNKILFFERQLAMADDAREKEHIERTLSILRYGNILESATS